MFIDVSLGEDMPSLKMEALPIKRIPNLSCSLLGALFQLEHFHFRQENDGKKSWEEDADVPDAMLTNEANFVYMPEVTVVGWKIAFVESCVIPYKHPFQKKSEYDAKKQGAEEVGRKRGIDVYLKEWEELTSAPQNSRLRIADFEGRAQVNHVPTNLNFWHFTIDSYPAESDVSYLKKASEGWRENMAVNFADILRRTFIYITDTTDIPPISDASIWEKH